MEILKKINEGLVTSMKSKEEGSDLRTSTLRMMKSSIKNAEIAKRGKGELTEEDILGVLSTMVKQRRESVEQYLKANRKCLKMRTATGFLASKIFLLFGTVSKKLLNCFFFNSIWYNLSYEKTKDLS